MRFLWLSLVELAGTIRGEWKITHVWQHWSKMTQSIRVAHRFFVCTFYGRGTQSKMVEYYLLFNFWGFQASFLGTASLYCD